MDQVVPLASGALAPRAQPVSIKRESRLHAHAQPRAHPGKRRAEQQLVPEATAPKRSKSASPGALDTPPAEYPGKLRWCTPSRAGTWPEKWASARELGLHVAVRAREARPVEATVRNAIASAVVSHVGDLLPQQTVMRWLCLLCEYLELNADEQVLVVCLLRRYVRAGGRFVGAGDWARPQRWECVVAVACYLAVLHTEEFPGRTAMDLRELLGGNFRFGREQVAFLKLVDWRICVADTQFAEVKKCCLDAAEGKAGAEDRLADWLRKKRPAEVPAAQQQAPSSAVAVPTAAIVPAAKTTKTVALEMKAPVVPFFGAPQMMEKTHQQQFATIAPAAGDSMVPVAFVPQFGTTAATIPQQFVMRYF